MGKKESKQIFTGLLKPLPPQKVLMKYKSRSEFMNWRLSKRSVGERYEDEAVKVSDFTLAAVLKIHIPFKWFLKTFPQLYEPSSEFKLCVRFIKNLLKQSPNRKRKVSGAAAASGCQKQELRNFALQHNWLQLKIILRKDLSSQFLSFSSVLLQRQVVECIGVQQQTWVPFFFLPPNLIPLNPPPPLSFSLQVRLCVNINQEGSVLFQCPCRDAHGKLLLTFSALSFFLLFFFFEEWQSQAMCVCVCECVRVRMCVCADESEGEIINLSSSMKKSEKWDQNRLQGRCVCWWLSAFKWF